MEQRIQKFFAGFCSRRTADAYIAAGRVTVNGVTAIPGQKADLEKDIILLDGKAIPGINQDNQDKMIYLMLNKPRGYVTTMSDERGRRTVLELIKNCGARVYPVGRLDMDSEGLLLFTNDGDLTRRLTHPSSEIEKAYEVTVAGADETTAARLADIKDLDGKKIRPARVKFLRHETRIRRDKDNKNQEKKEILSVFLIMIHEGKNRQVRRMCEQCGCGVAKLRRVREGNLKLGNLKRGEWRYLTPEEIAALREE